MQKKKTTKSEAAKPKITGKITLGDLVVKYPETAQIMFSYGLHCIGCHMAANETLEQGALAHGLDKKTIEKMLNEMNAAIE